MGILADKMLQIIEDMKQQEKIRNQRIDALLAQSRKTIQELNEIIAELES